MFLANKLEPGCSCVTSIDDLLSSPAIDPSIYSNTKGNPASSDNVIKNKKSIQGIKVNMNYVFLYLPLLGNDLLVHGNMFTHNSYGVRQMHSR